MWGEGSGATLADLDPKGHVTLKDDDKSPERNLKSTEEVNNDSPSSLLEGHSTGAQTPNLINGSNEQFQIKNKDKEENDDEKKEPYIPSPKPVCLTGVSKGSILEKRKNFERKNCKQDVKETTKHDKGTRQSKLRPPGKPTHQTEQKNFVEEQNFWKKRYILEHY